MNSVLLISIENINNRGDDIIRISTEYLINRVYGDINEDYSCEQMNLMPRLSDLPFIYKPIFFLGAIMKRISKRLSGKSGFVLFDLGYKIQYSRYFSKRIKTSDVVFYTVGMLKYSTQNLSFVFHLINSLANKYNKPVFMNALSVEPADRSDIRYHQLVSALSFPCLKGITTRDGEEGLQLLRDCYINSSSIISDYVGDPALWVNDCFEGIQDNRSRSSSKLIGIGLVRKDIFNLYHMGISSDKVFLLYSQIISEIIRRGYDFFLFCNGIKSDYLFGKELIYKLQLPENKLLPPPRTAKDLIDMLSCCNAVFGARLHACICSVALGIPVSGMIWDRKIESFSSQFAIRRFFVSSEELDGSTIVDKLESAMTYCVDRELINKFKERTLIYIRRFLMMRVS